MYKILQRANTTVRFKNILTFSLRFNHYKTLGVREGAPKDQIKKAYIKLTKKYHPDTNQEDPDKAQEKFLKITEAYEALTKKGSTEVEVSDENISRRDRQQAARRQAREDIDEKLKWKGLEENKRAVNAYKFIRYIVYAGIVFNILILIGATEEIFRYFKIGEIYQEDEVLDECVLRASQVIKSEEYKQKNKEICLGEKKNLEK